VSFCDFKEPYHPFKESIVPFKELFHHCKISFRDFKEPHHPFKEPIIPFKVSIRSFHVLFVSCQTFACVHFLGLMNQTPTALHPCVAASLSQFLFFFAAVFPEFTATF
jgi:hypothetical protein